MSGEHFEQLFVAWAGVSPQQFVSHLSSSALKGELLKTARLLASEQQPMHTIQCMTPSEYKTQGHGIEISYGIAPSPFGDALVASTDQGICALEFLDDDLDLVIGQLQTSWHHAPFYRDDEHAAQLCRRAFSPASDEGELPLLLKGTPFQVKVWQALLRIPSGSIASYSSLAAMMGIESSVRAVASAVAKNPLGYLIPCHRVIRSTGIIHNYRWRSERKSLLLGWELSQQPVS